MKGLEKRNGSPFSGRSDSRVGLEWRGIRREGTGHLGGQGGSPHCLTCLSASLPEALGRPAAEFINQSRGTCRVLPGHLDPRVTGGCGHWPWDFPRLGPQIVRFSFNIPRGHSLSTRQLPKDASSPKV